MVSDGTETYYSANYDGDNYTLEQIADEFAESYDFNGELTPDEIALSVTVTNLENNASESFSYRGSYFLEAAEDED
jgi:hypothetical protein